MTLIFSILDCVGSEFSKQLLWIQNLSPQNLVPLWALCWSGCRFLPVDSFPPKLFYSNQVDALPLLPVSFVCFRWGRVATGQSALFSLPQGWWIEFSLLPWTSVFKLDLATVTNIIPLFHTQLQAIFPAWRRFEFISKRVYNAYLTLWALTDVT